MLPVSPSSLARRRHRNQVCCRKSFRNEISEYPSLSPVSGSSRKGDGKNPGPVPVVADRCVLPPETPTNNAS